MLKSQLRALSVVRIYGSDRFHGYMCGKVANEKEAPSTTTLEQMICSACKKMAQNTPQQLAQGVQDNSQHDEDDTQPGSPEEDNNASETVSTSPAGVPTNTQVSDMFRIESDKTETFPWLHKGQCRKRRYLIRFNCLA